MPWLHPALMWRAGLGRCPDQAGYAPLALVADAVLLLVSVLILRGIRV
ncbi:MAG: hypothetical protein IPO43_04625 [Rhodoferax sp.]|nr:hypothetical protein [Rhodoferax sp.]